VIGVTILGSTGTIGVNTLDVIARHPDRFQVTALTANEDVEDLRNNAGAGCRGMRSWRIRIEPRA
jgi:1-deoxy-D-xylulose-5-phosphate reductoisomerase